MEVGGQLYSLATLSLGKEPGVLTEWGARLAPEPVWLWWRDKLSNLKYYTRNFVS